MAVKLTNSGDWKTTRKLDVMTNGLLQEVRECIAWEELARPVKFSLAGNAEAIATATAKEGALRSLLPAAAFVRGETSPWLGS